MPEQKVNWDEVRDELITDFCQNLCKDYMIDYECPDHKCPVWRTLTFSTNEDLNDSHTKAVKTCS